MVFIAKYNDDYKVDEQLIKLIRYIRDKIQYNNDDGLILNVGMTGSGKSNLSALQYILYCVDTEPKPEHIVLTMKDFANMIGRLSKIPKNERVIIYDELELSKRSSMSRWNKDVMTLYFKIRGLNCLHIWNHPSLEMVDKAFIKERINGVFVVLDKSKDRPRRYAFLRKKDVLDMFDKYKTLNIEVLKKHAQEYAYYLGSFGRCDHHIMERYSSIKADGMEDAIKTFMKKYGDKPKRKVKDGVNDETKNL